jgi:ABC-2 type transport system permease protein
MSTIYILWVRQLKRYLRSTPRLIGSLGQPILFLVALGFGLGPVFQKAGQGNYLTFLVPGIIAQSILFTAVFNGIELIWDRQFGFLKETLVAPVSRFNIMIGRTLGGATIAMIQGTIIFFLSLLIGFRPYNLYMIPVAILVMFCISLLFTALGTAIASSMDDFHGFQLIINFLVMPLFFLSGALFPLNNLPKLMEIVTQVDPLTYGVDGLRGALIGASHFAIGFDVLVLVCIATILCGVGAYLFSKVQV